MRGVTTKTSTPLTLIRKALAFLKRDAREQWTYKISLTLNIAGVLANILTFYFISKLVDQNASSMSLLNAHEYSEGYFSFVLLGIALAGFQSTGLQSFSDAILREQETGTLEAVMMTRTRLEHVILYGSLWSFVFTALRIALYLTIGIVFLGASFGQANLLSALITILLTISSLAGIGMVSAGLVLVSKQSSPINFILTGLSRLLSGVYFPLAVMPVWMQWGSSCLPLTYALRAFRKSLIEGQTLSQLTGEFSALLLFSVSLLPLGILFFQWAVRRAKRDGSLSFI